MGIATRKLSILGTDDASAVDVAALGDAVDPAVELHPLSAARQTDKSAAISALDLRMGDSFF